MAFMRILILLALAACSERNPNAFLFGFGPDVISGYDACFDHDIVYPQMTQLGTHMLAVDPKLVDPATGNYHLGAQSAGIDAADPASTDAIDFDGTTRPQGAGRDIGAFEYH